MAAPCDVQSVAVDPGVADQHAVEPGDVVAVVGPAIIAESTIQMLLSRERRSPDTTERTKAIRLPSGEICVSLTN